MNSLLTLDDIIYSTDTDMLASKCLANTSKSSDLTTNNDTISYESEDVNCTCKSVINNNFSDEEFSNKCNDKELLDIKNENSLWDNFLYSYRGSKKSNDKIIDSHIMNRRRLILHTPFSTRSTISYGLIVYAKDTKRWAIIQRKHSVEFLLYIRGLYRLTYLPLLLSCITKDEAAIIDRCLKGGPEVLKHVYLKELELYSSTVGKELDYALIRMSESHLIVSNLLLKLNFTANKLKWTWPKGRLHISSDNFFSGNRETPFDCAKREFTEEVEIILPPPLYISDKYISENVKTITGRIIESRYWIYIISNEIPMTTPKFNPEVADRVWTDTDTCKKLLHYTELFEHVIDIVDKLD